MPGQQRWMVLDGAMRRQMQHFLRHEEGHVRHDTEVSL